MHSKATQLIVHDHLFPRRGENSPISFSIHLSRNLIPEVRKETQCFYGTLDGLEAQYPGLDYSYPPHRMRLSRFPWHRRLFRAFDELGLTPSEIAGLCRWEGTLYAKESKEKEEGIKIKDTTGDDIAVWVPSRRPVDHQEGLSTEAARSNGQDRTDDAEDVEESDEEIESVGIELHQRLIARAAARESGEGVVMDEEWEQWLKEAAERGALEDIPGGSRSWPPIFSRTPTSAVFTPATPNTPTTAAGTTSAPTAVSTRIAF
ncbi:MAG: hypothetical protein M1812_003529 [Candelaria pacifica]|nr:MAG: hypothetical protein M1812_003529 [Candelaria pacifica]